MPKIINESMSPVKLDDELLYMAGIRLRELGYDWHSCFVYACGQGGCTDVVKVSDASLICLSGWAACHESLTGEPHPFADLLVAHPYGLESPPARLGARDLTTIINDNRHT